MVEYTGYHFFTRKNKKPVANAQSKMTILPGGCSFCYYIFRTPPLLPTMIMTDDHATLSWYCFFLLLRGETIRMMIPPTPPPAS